MHRLGGAAKDVEAVLSPVLRAADIEVGLALTLDPAKQVVLHIDQRQPTIEGDDAAAHLATEHVVPRVSRGYAGAGTSSLPADHAHDDPYLRQPLAASHRGDPRLCRADFDSLWCCDDIHAQ